MSDKEEEEGLKWQVERMTILSKECEWERERAFLSIE